ncbi:metallodipeptidase [Lachancea thermotolerans CBS 6340]|uniref:Cys-Gly metallodipeptidase DUG1 n=1 Tax=Lachancea thermotolerans (strain ATCC 56472 / CBS 6340 / NRRL Y-8284) TaxID=559295 RepID=C5DLI5_LACTC|nr:KLTH0G00990p [Lachancea thermotolerans CBS 6340]CAR24646.1 KLTH0G00990p [Lachancea thermotolerans CBS 6340]
MLPGLSSKKSSGCRLLSIAKRLNITHFSSGISHRLPQAYYLRRFHIYRKMSTEANFQQLFNKIDELKPRFIERLAKAIEIPAVSSDESLRPQVIKKAQFIAGELQKLGFSDIQMKELGAQPPPVADPNLPLPPVVLARYGSDPAKKTVLVYGHYDVQPAALEDGWATEPFKLIIDEEKQLMRARGASDDTGPLKGWLNVVEAHRELGLDLPVNLVTCFEGMEESGSIGLDGLIAEEAGKYFKEVDAVCISDNYWLGTKKPVLTYGLRGCNYFQITIEGPAADLHSGIFGGVISEPMIDLTKVFSSLVDSRGRILIDGVNEMVAPVTEKEKELYEKIDFTLDEMNAASGSQTCLYESKADILMHRWRYPSLSIHGLEGAFSAQGAKTVIPSKVVGKFSIRTVPDMDSAKLDKFVIDHCDKVFASLNSPNRCKTELIHDGNYWISDPFNASFTAAAKATKAVYGVEPDFTREGGSIPITLTFEKELKTSVMLLPMGRGDDGAHSINEKLDISNYMQGMKTMAAYLHYYAASKEK